MALTLGDNFSYQGAKPLDGRLNYNTVAEMKAVADATMYNGCLAYCVEADKTYQWKSTNTVDETLGRWREFSSGGGSGTSDYEDLENKPQIEGVELEGDVSAEDLGLQKVLTAGDGIAIENDEISIDPMPAEDMDDVIDELPTGGNIAVTGYVPLGTIIQYYGETPPDFFLACDGSTYNKADYPELAKHLLSLTNNTPYIVDGDNTKFKVPDLRGEFIRGTGTNGHPAEGNGENVGVHQSATSMLMCWDTGSNLQFRALKNATSEIMNVDKSQTATGTIQTITATTSRADNGSVTHYTSRPTNTSVLFCIAYKDIYSNPMNDYSTDEKVVGTWIDGKTLYQKTFEVSGTWGAVGTWVNVDVDTDTTHSWKMTEGYDVGSGGSIPSLSPAVNGSIQYAKTIGLNSGKLALKYFNNLSSIVGNTFNAIVVARYTKTTD